MARAMARVVSALGLFLGLAGLLVLIPSLAVSGTFVSGLDYPTGLAIHPNERLLYVKSGITGRVWKIPIAASGTAGGDPVVMTDNFSLYHDIDFDASGNLYGAVVNNSAMVRLTSVGGVETADLYETPGGGGIAIEPPGLPTNKLYFVDDDFDLYFFPIASFFERDPDYYDGGDLGETCGQFRFLLHRLSLTELLGTYADKLVSVNPSNASCTTLLSGLIQPNGIAEDLYGNIYVADTLAGTVIKLTVLGQVEVIAEGLASPVGLAFDSVTGLLFVSETDADRITTLRVDVSPPNPSGGIFMNVRSLTGSWSGWLELPGGGSTPSQPAAVFDAGGNLYVFVQGTDNAMWINTRSASGTWSGWSQVPGGGRTSSGPTAVAEGNTIHLYVRGLDDGIYVNTRSESGQWSGWSPVPGGGATPASPEATTDEQGSVYLFVRGK